jgi:adenosylmethionine-8-amino-7-oxononanoate aminotransferase
MSHVFPRNCKTSLPLAVQGDGVYIIDSSGKRYIDASGGAAVSCLGHSDSRVIEAIKAQLECLEFAHTGFFNSVPAEALAELSGRSGYQAGAPVFYRDWPAFAASRYRAASVLSR